MVQPGDPVERVAHVQGAGGDPDEHDPERESDVADPVDDEGLLRRERRGAPAVPEADQQVARQAHELPPREDHQEVVRQDQQQHAEHEEVQVGEEAPPARVVRHVADRVQVDEHPDRRHDDQQAGGQLIDEEPDVDRERARRDPAPERDAGAVLAEAAGEGLVDHRHAEQPGGGDGEQGQDERGPPDPAPEECREDEARERDGRDERDEVDQAVRRAAAGRRRGEHRRDVRDQGFEHGGGSVPAATGACCRTRRRAACGGSGRWPSRSPGPPSPRPPRRP